MGADMLDVERAAERGFQRVIDGVTQVADARREAETQQVHQGEDVSGEARRIGVALLDPQFGFVLQQAVEHIGRVAHADVDHLGVER